MQQSKYQLSLRYIAFFIGLYLNSFGISVLTRANLGTSPISSIPYTLSYIPNSLSMGSFTFIFNTLLTLAQILILRRDFKLRHLAQIPASLIFSVFIDFNMGLLRGLPNTIYPLQLLFVVLGCLIMAFGIYVEVTADVIVLSAEGFVMAICRKLKKEFGNVKVVFDVSYCLLAALISYLLFHSVLGVREGTLIAAFAVGFFSRIFSRRLAFIRHWLRPETVKQLDACPVGLHQHHCITVSSEYGSGGIDIARRLAQLLDLPFYDQDIEKLVARESGYSEDFVAINEQRMGNRFVNGLAVEDYLDDVRNVPTMETLFAAQQRAIMQLASAGDCVIMGRNADQILGECQEVFSIFIHADPVYRIRRIMETDQIGEQEAAWRIIKVNDDRGYYYEQFSHLKWGQSQNYTVSISSSQYGTEETAQILAELYRRSRNQQEDSDPVSDANQALRHRDPSKKDPSGRPGYVPQEARNQN